MNDNYPDGVWSGSPMAPWNRPDELDLSDDGVWLENMEPVEQFAIAQAVYKAVASQCETGNPHNLRGGIDAWFKRLYEQTGAKSFDVKLRGRKVGTFSVIPTKTTPQSERTELAVMDEPAFQSWAAANGFLVVDMDAVRRHFADTGDVPDGCDAVKVITPEVVGGAVKSTRAVIDTQEVVSVLGDLLGPATELMLEEGE